MKHLILHLLLLLTCRIGLSQNHVGIGTDTPHAGLHVIHNDGIIAKGTLNSGTVLSEAGAGSKLIWYPRKAAFRAGYISGDHWNNDSIGNASFASGSGTKAISESSTAMGSGTRAAGMYATALGSQTFADGLASTSVGLLTIARGAFSFASGTLTNANGFASFTSGYYTMAKALAGTTIGIYNDTTDVSIPNTPAATDRIFQIGNGTSTTIRTNAMTVLKNGNTGIGILTPVEKLEVAGNIRATGTSFSNHINTTTATITGNINLPGGSVWNSGGDVGIGINTPLASLHVTDNGGSQHGFLVTGTSNAIAASPSLGPGSRLMYFPYRGAFRAGEVTGSQWDDATTGLYSVAMGYNTTASSGYTTALGRNTMANALYSTALGQNTIAGGYNSTAMGLFTDARGFAATVVGMYNDPVLGSYQTTASSVTSATPLFIVGNGNDGANRSNAMIVRKDGNLEVAGRIRQTHHAQSFTVPANGASNFVWTHNLGYQPIIMISLDQTGGGYADFVNFSYGHNSANQLTIFLTNRHGSNPATGNVRWIVVY